MKNIFIPVYFIAHFFCTFSLKAAPADSLILSRALQSNMVVQQNRPFKIWGRSTPGEKVAVTADWLSDRVTVTANTSGNFIAIIQVPPAVKGDFKPRSLTVENGHMKSRLSNLLIGDVWLMSGQSNMQFSVKEMIGAKDEIENANLPSIRLLNVALNFSQVPVDNFKGTWKICSPETVKNFSAVGYSFGKRLYEQLNIPVGLVFSGIGASAVQAFVPRETLQNDSLLNAAYLQPYLNSSKSKERIDSGFTFEKVTRPFLLYNALINPLVNLSIRGICWYQGESNVKDRLSYTVATQKMIAAWREKFGQGDLPFYYVQIAPFYHDKENDKLTTDAFFREAQEKISSVNNTAMVLTMDAGEAKNLHPKDKKPIGIRLAQTALNQTYGMSDFPWHGPEYKYVNYHNDKATVCFNLYSKTNKLTTNDNAEPRYFYLAGDDRVFFPAKAEIKDNTVVLTCKKVKRPVAVRYAFFNYPVTNLQNREGLPAHPFRTDDWPETKDPE